MPLNQEQAQQIKEQLLKQVSNLPPEQQEQAEQQINAMTTEQLEKFLIQSQKTIQKPSQGPNCVFCSILEGKIPSYKIDENKDNIAILEIAPLSKGHSLVISKQHNKLSNSAFTLANKIAKKIKLKLKPEEIKIETSNILGHELIQILPLYKDKKLEKHKAEEKELILLQDQLKAKPKKSATSKKIKPVSLLKIKPRIP